VKKFAQLFPRTRYIKFANFIKL